jgi:multiple sugar transport system substrate-binding protein
LNASGATLDFDRPEWDATRELMSRFHWGGRNYTAITEVTNSTAMLFYRNTVAQGAGLDDPYQLWRNGEWTWDAMLDMVSQFSVRDEKWGIFGFYIDEAAMLSTGVGMISIEDGILKSNMDDNRIERAMGRLRDFAVGDFRFPYHERTDFNMPLAEFRNGDILFWQDGPWRFQEHFTKFRADDNWADTELRIVPFPRDPEADRLYIRGKQDAMMLVRGSQNYEGFLAWTYSLLIAHQDPGMHAVGRMRDKENHNWTEHQLDILEELRDPTRSTLVWDFKNGIGLDIACGVTDSLVESLTKPVIVDGASFPEQREAVRGAITARIALMNARVQSGQMPTDPEFD